MYKSKNSLVEEVILCIVLIIISCWLLQGKNNFHIDETFSYGLANHVNGVAMLPPQEGERFSPTEKAYYKYLTVEEGHRFNYEVVWINQETDVHPPFYYVILHTICSFFPGQFSRWYAGIINIVAICITLFFLRRILQLIGVKQLDRLIISCIFIASSGVGSTISFLRMYALTMLWITITIYIFLKTMEKRTLTWKDCLMMFLIALCGSLTHYYYLVFLFFLCCTYFVYLIYYEKKKIFLYLFTYVLAGIIALWLFPPMTFHMFKDDRGIESIDNLNAFTVEIFLDRIKKMSELVSEQIGGDYVFLLLLGIVIIFFIMMLRIKKTKCEISNILWGWGIIIIPTICYYLLVSQIAVYIDSRYMIPIYGLLIIVIYGIIFKFLAIFLEENVSKVVSVILGLFFTISMILNYSCNYRKLPMEWNEHFEKNAKIDCVYIHDNSWRMQASFTQIRNYDSVIFFSQDYFNDYGQEDSNIEELVVVIVDECNQDKLIKKVMSLYPKLSTYKKIGQVGYSTTYVFSD